MSGRARLSMNNRDNPREARHPRARRRRRYNQSPALQPVCVLLAWDDAGRFGVFSLPIRRSRCLAGCKPGLDCFCGVGVWKGGNGEG